ncbi:MAG: biotin/lipoyl-binding protein, partial [Burkholderiales bacterium]
MPAAANEPDETDSAKHRILGWRPALWGWVLLVFGFGGVATWALLAPLDQGVSAGGLVVVSGKRKTVQHPTGGIVSEILVRDGDKVRTGQPLVKLNTTMASSQLETVRAQWLVARAVERRLAAERDGAASVSFPSSLLAEAGQG